LDEWPKIRSRFILIFMDVEEPKVWVVMVVQAAGEVRADGYDKQRGDNMY